MAGKKWSKEAPMVWGRPMGGGGAKYVKIGEEMKHFFHIFLTHFLTHFLTPHFFDTHHIFGILKPSICFITITLHSHNIPNFT